MIQHDLSRFDLYCQIRMAKTENLEITTVSYDVRTVSL